MFQGFGVQLQTLELIEARRFGLTVRVAVDLHPYFGIEQSTLPNLNWRYTCWTVIH